MIARWEHILGVALDALEEDPTALERARESLRQLRGLAAVRVEVVEPEPFDPHAVMNESSGFERLVRGLETGDGLVFAGVDVVGGPVLWVGEGRLEYLPYEVTVSGIEAFVQRTGTVRYLEIYTRDGEPFTLFAVDPLAVTANGYVTYGGAR